MKLAELDETPQQAEAPSWAYEELLARERRLTAELEQKLATREKDGQLLAQERALTKELEEQLAARQNDQQLLALERQRSKELEEQLATRQSDQPSLAQSRVRIRELEQQLAASRQLPLLQQPTSPPGAADSRNMTPFTDRRTK